MMFEVVLAACCASASLAWRDDYFDTSTAVVAEGDTAYVAALSSGVLVMDVRDKASPKLLGVCEMSGRAVELRLSGSLLYVAGLSQGLVICDVTTPSAPTVVGTLPCPLEMCTAEQIDVVGTTVYIGDWVNYAMYIVDAADPTSPQLLGTYTWEEYRVHGVVVSGSYAYVASSGGLAVVDVANPTAPTRVGLYAGVEAFRVLVSGGQAYLGAYDPVVHIVDVSNPTAPVLTGSIHTEDSPSSMALRGSTLYVACQAGGMQIINVSNLASPSVLGAFDCYAFGVTTWDTMLLATCSDATLQVIDTTTPSTPVGVGKYGQYGDAEGVHAAGGLAVVGGRREIRVYDVSEPLVPVQLSVLSVSGSDIRPLIRGSLIYLATSNGFSIVDITDPSAPSLLGSSRAAGAVRDLWVVGTTVYLAATFFGFHIFDVTDPRAPVNVGVYGDINARSVVVSGSLAYVAAGKRGLVILDVSDRSNPTEISSRVILGEPQEVSVVGEMAYVASKGEGLQVLNVSDIMGIEVVGNYSLQGAGCVSVVGDIAYVGDYKEGLRVLDTGLRIFDVTDVTTPVLVGTATTDGMGKDVYAVGPTVYVADKGLRVIDATDIPATTAPYTEAPTPLPAGEGEVPVAGESSGESVSDWVWVLITLGVVGVGIAVGALYLATRKVDIRMEHSKALPPSAPDTEV